MPGRTVGTATVAGIAPSGGGVRTAGGGVFALLALCPIGLGMIALPVRTWLGSIVGGGVVVGRGPGVAVGEPPQATMNVTPSVATRARQRLDAPATLIPMRRGVRERLTRGASASAQQTPHGGEGDEADGHPEPERAEPNEERRGDRDIVRHQRRGNEGEQ